MRLLMISFMAWATLCACTPEVGSKAWCEQLQAKPKGDWTANEAADYARHCLFK